MVATGVTDTKSGEAAFRMTPAPISVHDYLVLVFVIALQVLLVGFLWWSRRRITHT